MSFEAITPAQCVAAREMLGWSHARLAGCAVVAVQTVVAFERGACTPHQRNLDAIRAALEAGGVAFIDPPGDPTGVRLRKPAKGQPPGA